MTMMKTQDRTTMMTFDEAVEICKQYSHSGLLLDGLLEIEREMEEDEDDNFLSPRQIMAFRLVCREMRPLFV